jgi:hypothetical protein
MYQLIRSFFISRILPQDDLRVPSSELGEKIREVLIRPSSQFYYIPFLSFYAVCVFMLARHTSRNALIRNSLPAGMSSST